MTVMSLKQITSSTGRHYTTAINTSHESHHLGPGTIVDINVIYSTLMKNKKNYYDRWATIKCLAF